MKLAPQNKQFLRPEEKVTYAASKFVVLPAPLEETVSYGHGTGKGPAAIIAASSQVEFWDTELKKSPLSKGIATLEALKFGADAEKNLAIVAASFLQILRERKIPVMLGGEHTITLGGVAALAAYLKELGKVKDGFTILQFDAHGDLRFEYEETVYSHACVMRQALEQFPEVNLVQVGIRAICEEEENFIAANKKRVSTFFAHDRKNWHAEKILKAIPTKDVYLTFDVDGLDPSILPATGTPVPDGLLWAETLEILRLVATKKNIVAMDIVELAPSKGFSYCDFATALLVTKMIAYAS